MIGVLMLGIVIGAILYNSIYVVQFEKLVSLKSELEVKLDQYELDLKQLKKFKNQHTVIKSINPRIEEEAGQNPNKPDLDLATQAELIKRIKEDLSSFYGQSVYEIDSNALFVRKILERKVYTNVYNKDYMIELKTILIAENVLHVWVKVKIYAKPPL